MIDGPGADRRRTSLLRSIIELLSKAPFSNGLDRRAAVVLLTIVVGSSLTLTGASRNSSTRLRTTAVSSAPTPSTTTSSTSFATQTPTTVDLSQASGAAEPTVAVETDAPTVAGTVPLEVAPAAAATVAAVTVPATKAAPPKIDPGNPQVVARPIPTAPVATTPAPGATAPPWEASTTRTPAGYVSTDVGCAANTSAGALDSFFKNRVGPMLGADYQHVYPLGGSRYLWLFQDAFIDHSGAAPTLGKSGFAHNVAFVQDGACFTMLHRGSAAKPAQFESGTGTDPANHWFWPMGGELSGGRLQVFWVEEAVDGSSPGPGDGLGWHPVGTYLASYDTTTLARESFTAAPNAGVRPIYGYAVSTDADYTYLFANTFEQNLSREGGYFNGPHSATSMYLARVPKGNLEAAPEYRTATDWSSDPGAAVPIVQRYWAENPMEPRYLNGQWVAATKVDGYWGSELSIDVAIDPWGPWTTVEHRGVAPRNNDSTMNTYHAYLMPWMSGGNLVVSISQNGRDMVASAYPHPERYRLAFFNAKFVAAPPNPPPPTVPPDTTLAPDTTPSPVTAASTAAPAPTQPSTTAAATAPPTVATTAPPPPTSPAPTTAAPPTTAALPTTTAAPSTSPSTAPPVTTRPSTSVPSSTAAVSSSAASTVQ